MRLYAYLEGQRSKPSDSKMEIAAILPKIVPIGVFRVIEDLEKPRV
jgi:hypothetical protein